LFEYYTNFGDNNIKNIILRSEEFITKCLKIVRYDRGTCINYHPSSVGCCYNANMHAAECLARINYFRKDKKLKELIISIVDFVVANQRDTGVWYYGFKDYGGYERKQIDFHQGFILESFFEIKNLINYSKDEWENSISKGLAFYYSEQFNESGKSLWRIPEEYPVDIHNQAQGIITFCKLGSYNSNYKDFAYKIAKWTIDHMQDRKKGYFYYRIYRRFSNTISYMRWNQAWMFLALSTCLVINSDDENEKSLT